MKTILFTILLFMVPADCFAGEYGPHVKVTFEYLNELRSFSGTVIESPEEEIKVVTCWHGTMGFSRPEIMEVELFQPKVDSSQLSAAVMLSIIKSDSDRDVIILSGENKLSLKIKRLKLSKFGLTKGVKAKSYGYATTKKLIVNDVTIIDYEMLTQGNNRILGATSPVIFGMSGGGLLYNEELYGVQSSGNNDIVHYCPSYQLINFVEDN